MTNHVPTIDIANPSGTEVDALDTACRDHGFFLLTGHGLDPLIERTFAEGAKFFDADRQTKESIRRTETRPLGYNDRELTKRLRDHKEVFDFIDPERPGDYNQWPAGLAEYRETLTEFFDAFADLAVRTTNLVLATLGLEGDQAAAYQGSRTSSTVRLNRYAVGDPVPADERDDLASLGDVALGHHTDPGILTLLLQDNVGGLQADSRDHGWIDIEPQPGTIVVNLADSLQVWTNDQYRAAIHRVKPMTTTTRMSIPFFFNPPSDAVIEPIDHLAGGSPKYRAFTWKEFMGARNADNYADLGEADTQIANYALTS